MNVADRCALHPQTHAKPSGPQKKVFGSEGRARPVPVDDGEKRAKGVEKKKREREKKENGQMKEEAERREREDEEKK